VATRGAGAAARANAPNAEDDPEGQARAAAFRQGLQALGWTEGKNLHIDWHWTAGDVGRIRSDVTELAGYPPDIIVANGRVTLSEAVQAIRSTPIVFVLVTDPVGQGFISSLARPGGKAILIAGGGSQGPRCSRSRKRPRPNSARGREDTRL
jgi:ABC transporter substrate binding protein